MTDLSRGARRPRLEDVAAHVGVSTASVSLVLRNAPGPSAETRRRVLAAAAELGYRPDRTASLLARRRTHLLGVMLDVSDPFHAELVTELHDAAEQLGYDLVLSTVTRTRTEQRAVETLVDFRCEALILLGPEASASALRAMGRQVPVAVIGRRVGSTEVDVIRTADDRGVELAVDHLADLGHREIAFVDGGKGPIATERRRGYRSAMRHHGLAEQVRVVPGDHTESAGSRAASQLLTEQRLPTAVIAFNDRCALGLIDTFSREAIAIPEAVSVVGFDDIAASGLAHVQLTTVRQDARLQAEQTVGLIARHLEGADEGHQEVLLSPQLIVRATTAPPPTAAGSAPTGR